MPRKEKVISKIKRDYRPNENLAVIILSSKNVVELAEKEGVTLSPEEVDEILEVFNRQQDAFYAITLREIRAFLLRRRERMFNETQSSISLGEKQ